MMRPRDKASVWLLEAVWPCLEFPNVWNKERKTHQEVGVPAELSRVIFFLCLLCTTCFPGLCILVFTQTMYPCVYPDYVSLRFPGLCILAFTWTMYPCVYLDYVSLLNCM